MSYNFLLYGPQTAGTYRAYLERTSNVPSYLGMYGSGVPRPYPHRKAPPMQPEPELPDSYVGGIRYGGDDLSQFVANRTIPVIHQIPNLLIHERRLADTNGTASRNARLRVLLDNYSDTMLRACATMWVSIVADAVPPADFRNRLAGWNTWYWVVWLAISEAPGQEPPQPEPLDNSATSGFRWRRNKWLDQFNFAGAACVRRTTDRDQQEARAYMIAHADRVSYVPLQHSMLRYVSPDVILDNRANLLTLVGAK